MAGVVRGTRGVVVVTGLGFTAVDVELAVEVVVEVEVEVVLDEVVGSGTAVVVAATAGRPGMADAPPAHHATVPAINASTPRTAPAPTSGR